MKKIEETIKRKVPLKNYFVLLLIFAFTIGLTLYINEWIKTYNENKISISPLSNEVNEVNISELDVAFNEVGETILYVSYTNNQKIYNNEEKLLKYLKQKNKLDYMIYLNVNDYLYNDDYLNLLRNKFPNLSEEIKKAPLLIYINNGIGKKVINSNNRIIDDLDFAKMIEIYELED